MVVLSSLLGAPENEEVRAALQRGDLPPSADVDQLAAFYTTVLEGLSTQARDGASAEKPNRITDAPMLAWPPA